MSYDDLIYIDYKAKMKHHPMDRAKRAAQFSPFAALTGYDKAIEEESRVTEEKRILTSDEFSEIERKLQNGINRDVAITYFKKDESKSGGTYLTINSKIVKLLIEKKRVLLEDGTLLNIKDIFSLEIKDNKSYVDYQ